MAAVVGNDEEQRVIDRIRTNAYREAMEKSGLWTTEKRDTNIVLRN